MVTITNAHQLSDIRNNPSTKYKLGAHINVMQTFGNNWVPIPYLDINGVLDGNGYIIELTIIDTVTHDGQAFGLFARNNGTITNVHMGTLQNFAAGIGDHSDYWSYHGAIAGVNESSGTISNSSVWGQMLTHRINSHTGGIVGVNYGTVYGCMFYFGIVQGNGDLGGIAGANLSGGKIIESNVESSRIEHFFVLETRSVGGLVGWCSNASFINSRVYNSTIANIGQGATTGMGPNMGIVVGLFHNSTLISTGWVTSNTLEAGTLTQFQQLNFGSTSWWQWGGVAVGELWIDHIWYHW